MDLIHNELFINNVVLYFFHSFAVSGHEYIGIAQTDTLALSQERVVLFSFCKDYAQQTLCLPSIIFAP